MSEKPKEEAKDDSKETEKQKIDKQKAIEHPYDSNKKNARMLINQDNSISVQGDYNPDFIDYAHKNKAKRGQYASNRKPA